MVNKAIGCLEKILDFVFRSNKMNGRSGTTVNVVFCGKKRMAF